jgi:MFS family permease
MIMSDLFRGSILVFFIVLIPLVPYQWTYAFLFVDSALSLFFIPANQSLLPYIVNKKDRPTANGLLQSSFMIMRMAGHGVAAFFISIGISIQFLLILSATLIMISLLLIRRIKPFIKIPIEQGESEWKLIINGISYIWNNRLIRGVFSLFIIAWFVGSSIELIFVMYLTSVLGLGVENISFFTITQFIGMIIGAAAAPHFYDRFDQKWYFVFPNFAFAVALLSLNVIGGLTWVLPFFLIAGFSFGIFNVALPTFIQQTADNRYYSRIFSFHTMIFNFMPLPGLLFFGVIVAKLGIKLSVIVVTIFLLAVGLAALLFLPKLGTSEEEGKGEEKLQVEDT